MDWKNNRGYMLVEIILAFSIAFGITYFIIDLTINLKNKNDDMLVETLVSTDQAIIMNKLMGYMTSQGETFNCSSLTISNKTVSYGGTALDVINKYTTVGTKSCTKDTTDRSINITIPLTVKQMNNKHFDVKLNYKY